MVENQQGTLAERSGRVRTVSHAHAEVVNRLPIGESLNDRSLHNILFGIVVVLQEMADHELVLALGTEKQSQTDVVNEYPCQGVNVVKDESAFGRERRDQCHSCSIRDNQDEHGVGCPGRKVRMR